MIKVDVKLLGWMFHSDFFRSLTDEFLKLDVFWDPDEQWRLHFFKGSEEVGQLSTRENFDYPVIYEGLLENGGARKCLILRGRQREDFNEFPFDVDRWNLYGCIKRIVYDREWQEKKRQQRVEDKRVSRRFKISGLEIKELRTLEDTLRPGCSSGAGFIGNSESLASIVEQDGLILSKLGITHQQIADKLSDLVGKASEEFDKIYRQDGLDRYFKIRSQGVIIDEKFRVSAIGWQGYQGCTWCEVALSDYKETNLKASVTKYDFTVVNEKTGFAIVFSGLLPHLIGTHDFFEGQQTSYRLEPLKAILALDIGSVSFTRSQIEEMWYEQLKEYSRSSNLSEFNRAISGFYDFTKRADLSEVLSDMIIICRENKRYRQLEGLTNLAERLPEGGGRNSVNRMLIESISHIDEPEHAYDKTTEILSTLKRFKREVEGTKHKYLISGEYWPEYVETNKRALPIEKVDFYVSYIKSQDPSLLDLFERALSFFNDYYSSRGSDPITADILLRGIQQKDYFGFEESRLGEVLERCKSSDAGLQQKLDFYLVAMDLSAVLMAESQFEYSVKNAISASEELGKIEEKERLEEVYSKFRRISNTPSH